MLAAIHQTIKPSVTSSPDSRSCGLPRREITDRLFKSGVSDVSGCDFQPFLDDLFRTSSFQFSMNRPTKLCISNVAGLSSSSSKRN